jgi:hypothetical protein
VLVPLVPGRGFEPRSPVLQTGAVTRSAFRATQELVRTPVIETGPSEWRSETRPSSYIREAKRFRAKWVPVSVKKTRQRKLGGKWRESNFRPAKGRRLQRRDGTSRPYGHFPGVVCAFARADWRKVKESNHRRFRRPGFRDRLLAAERHLPKKLGVAGWLEHPASRSGTVCSSI